MVSVPALVIFLFPLAYSPGPGNLFFAANGARFGFRSTLGANAGYHLATLVVSIGLGLGFGAGIDRYPSALAAVKIAGGIYVLRLAWGLLRSTSPSLRWSSRSTTSWRSASGLPWVTRCFDGFDHHRVLVDSMERWPWCWPPLLVGC